MLFRKILKLVSGIAGFLLAVSLGITLSSSAQKAAGSSWSDIALAIVSMAVLAHISLGLIYFSLKATPKRIVRALSLVLSGIVFAYLLDNLLDTGEFSNKRMVASGLYTLILALTVFSFRATERVSAMSNLAQITALSLVIYFIVFFEYQYGLFEKAAHQLDSAIAYESRFTEKGTCFPTLANRNTDMLKKYVADLEREEQKVDRYLPVDLTDDQLDAALSRIAVRHNIAIADHTYTYKNREFYTAIKVSQGVKGNPQDVNAFIRDITDGDMIVSPIKLPDISGTTNSDALYRFVFTTYSYIDFESRSYANDTVTCSFKPPYAPTWPLSEWLNDKQVTYQSLCHKKWSDKAYTEMMLYARSALQRTIAKGRVVSTLIERVDPSHAELKLDLPVCPLYRHQTND